MTVLDPSTRETGARETGSLLPVIRVIPPEAYQNPAWKGLAFAARDIALYALVVTGLILTDNPFAVAALWILAALVVSAMFVIGHDAAHGALFSSKRLNSIVGHFLMLPSWHMYESWVLGHNRIHHMHTVREGMDFVWHPTTPEQFARRSRWQRLQHRLDWSCLGPGAYYFREIWLNKMVRVPGPAKWRSAIRRDKVIVLAFVVVASVALAALGLAMYGSPMGAAWMVFKVLVVPFLAFCFVIGATVHVHHVAPDIRWYRRREWTKYAGQMDGTTILRVPRVLDVFMHQIFIHIPHHVDVRIPFYNLDMAAAAIKGTFPDVVDKKFRVRDWTANTKACKLFDFESGTWMTYKQASVHLAAIGEVEAERRLALCAERPVVR